jgi:hypothetical protein
VTEFSADTKTNFDIGATSAIKLRVNDWTMFHSRWTLVLQEKEKLLEGVIVQIDTVDGANILELLGGNFRSQAINSNCQTYHKLKTTFSTPAIGGNMWK